MSTCPARRHPNEEVTWGPCSYSICIPGNVPITHKSTPTPKGDYLSHWQIPRQMSVTQWSLTRSGGGSRPIDSQGRLLRAQVQMVGSWLPDGGGTNRTAEGKTHAGSPEQRLYCRRVLGQCLTVAPRPTLRCHNSTATEAMEGNWLFSESHCCGYFLLTRVSAFGEGRLSSGGCQFHFRWVPKEEAFLSATWQRTAYSSFPHRKPWKNKEDVSLEPGQRG